MHIKYYVHSFLQAAIDKVFRWLSYLLYLITPILKPIFNIGFNTSGIEVNGTNSWDIKVNDDRFYSLAVAFGMTGYIESYIEGYIDLDDLEEAHIKLARHPFLHVFEHYHPYRLLKYFIHVSIDVMTPDYIHNITNEHYEESSWLKDFSDESIQYSTLRLYHRKQIEDADKEELIQILNEAGVRTRDVVARKLKLEPGMKVLDIGCGYGGLAKHLAERYKVEVTGVTLCSVMAKTARKVSQGLPVKIIQGDYRTVTGKFDRIVSIEMFEHVGNLHHREYFEKVSSLLVDDGIFLFQAHHVNRVSLPSYSPLKEVCFDFYCYFPRIDEVMTACKGILIPEDMENLGYPAGISCKAYAKKGRAMKANSLQRMSEKEWRKYYIYANICAAAGFAGVDSVYQITFTKDGLYHMKSPL